MNTETETVVVAFVLMIPSIFCIWKALENVHRDVTGLLWLLASFVPLLVLALVVGS